jgi:hypothetical protein
MPESNMDGIYTPSEDIVAREVASQLLIVPLAAGIGDLEDELYTFSETGRAIWERLDGRLTLREVVAALAEEYDAEPGEIERDALDLMAELLKRRIAVEIPRA